MRALHYIIHHFMRLPIHFRFLLFPILYYAILYCVRLMGNLWINERPRRVTDEKPAWLKFIIIHFGAYFFENVAIRRFVN